MGPSIEMAPSCAMRVERSIGGAAGRFSSEEVKRRDALDSGHRENVVRLETVVEPGRRLGFPQEGGAGRRSAAKIMGSRNSGSGIVRNGAV